MDVRDAVEADANDLARLADGPQDVLRNVIHDRTVRVAVADDSVIGFVSFDARPGTVYVTQLGGPPEAVERLLAEPVRFADTEGMAVELLLAESAADLHGAATAAGFSREGPGPRFEAVRTIRFRYDPE